MAKKIKLSQLRAMLYDIDIDDADIRPYVTVDEDRSGPFSPVITINHELVEDTDDEGDIALGFLNSISRWRRQRRYRRKIDRGWTGLRVVSEGDSWFQYPFLLDDVIDQLFDDYAIYSLGAAGDHLLDIIAKDEFTQNIRDEQPHVFLISGGGNDLVGNGRLSTLLHRYSSNRKAENYPNNEFSRFLESITATYKRLFSHLESQFPNLKVVCHGYDYAIPNNGKWLGKPMQANGIEDLQLQKAIMDVIMEAFNTMMADIASNFINVFYVDCRNAVDPAGWLDELHPENPGFRNVGQRFRTVIDAIAPALETKRAAEPALCPGREQRIADAENLDEGDFQRLVLRRSRALASSTELPAHLENKKQRKSLEEDIADFYEKIHLGADFLPANFLRRGARRAEAVCKILTPGFVGTGFLVASRQFIMTNNHVIMNKDVAAGSTALFGFEVGGEEFRVTLNPDKFFMTDQALDFTIIACDDVRLGGIEPVPLLRNPATVTRHERVNIIQHPAGREKEIAIHDNKVTLIQDKVIHYRTDTEPGSSGSPVFNNTWDLVALHHAGWREAGSAATNEGVRIASIVAHIIRRQRAGTENQSEGLNEILATVPDSSPYLGFFDIAGFEDASDFEVEIPSYQGNADFADIGFWNIEHFNRHIDNQRLQRVTEVMNRLSMDVMGLVEVEAPAMERLVAAMRQNGNAYNFELLDVSGSQDLGVLYDEETSAVELLGEMNERYRDELDIVTHGGKKAFPRDPMFAKCTVSEGNSRPIEFIMIVVHFKAFGDAVSRERRRLASESLARIVEDIRQRERLPVILGGDFNEKLNNDVLSALSGSPDLFALTADDAMTSAASYIGGSRRSLIDHIIVSQDINPGAISGDDAAIVRLDRSVHDFADAVSDHVPLVMRLMMRDAPIDIPGGGATDEDVIVPVPEDSSTVKLHFE